MVPTAVARLEFLCRTLPPLLKAIPATEFSNKPASDKWSKKEELGHLIDSATNNHQRFVRIQFENEPLIMYDQNNWNSCSRYQDMDGSHVINFWANYNVHLAEVIKRIPADSLQRKGVANDNTNTLEWFITDYVDHMEHHLRKIVKY